jgi:hypothetical protein
MMNTMFGFLSAACATVARNAAQSMAANPVRALTLVMSRPLSLVFCASASSASLFAELLDHLAQHCHQLLRGA